ncbi:Uncharacterised protein [uncultured Clostridium sp.]|nr:Uncharacterised protein [uncultured Clostridium sp.]
MELMLKDGSSSRISCFVNFPILFCVVFLTISTASSSISTIENLSSILISSKNGAQNIFDERNCIFTAFISPILGSCKCIIVKVLRFCNFGFQRNVFPCIASRSFNLNSLLIIYNYLSSFEPFSLEKLYTSSLKSQTSFHKINIQELFVS